MIDTVVPPTPPHVEPPERIGGLIQRPFSPFSISDWSPAGTFLTGRTDEYALEIARAPEPGTAGEAAAAGADEGFEIRRQADPVPVLPEEREVVVAEIRGTLETLGESESTLEFPDTKPPLHGAWFDDEGRVWVHVSVPAEGPDPGSEGLDEDWEEPDVFDVFDASGEFLDRITLPSGGCTGRPSVRHDELWCEARGAMTWSLSADSGSG